MQRMVIVGTSVNSVSNGGGELLRVYRLDTKTVKDVPLESLEPVAEQLGIANLADFKETAIKSLYPKYYRGGATRLLSGADAYYVLGTHGTGGYVCIRPHVGHDFIRIIPRSRLVQDAKKGRLRLINAVVEQTVASDILAPITGDWEDMAYISGRTLAEGTEADSNGELFAVDNSYSGTVDASVGSHDELGVLNAQQKDFLKTYYIEYSVEAFKRIAGTTKWKLKEGKAEKLVELRKLSKGEDWQFAGLWDSGRFGGDKCEMGHKLRYVYMACPANKTFFTALKEGTLLKFGIVCHADFLEIPREDVARLGRLQDTMCDEIAFISSILANDETTKHNALMSSMHELLVRLRENGSLVRILDKRLATAYEGFCANNIPLVESFVLDTQRKLEEYGVLKVLSAAGVDVSGLVQTSEKLYTLPELPATATAAEKKQFQSRRRVAHQDGISALHRKHESFFVALARYAEMLIKNDICGEFMYIPTHEVTEFRRRGADKYRRYDNNAVAMKYNDETRDLRKYWMIYFTNHTYEKDYITSTDGLKAQYLSLAGLERAIELAKRLRTAGKNIAAAIGDAAISAISAKFSSPSFLGVQGADTLKTKLLLTALPYNVSSITYPLLLRRRAAFYVKSSKELLDLLDETADGTESSYIELLKQSFQPKETEVKDEIEPESEPVTQSGQELGQQSALRTQTGQSPVKTSEQQKVSRRGDPNEAKKLIATFNSLYNSVPERYRDTDGLAIALSIIARFNQKLKQKEGFTRSERWRMENEIERLQRTLKQLNKK